jgi:hypothetical protein
MKKIKFVWLIPAILLSLQASAQNSDKRNFVGMGAALGVTRQDVSSTFPALHGIDLLQEGGYIFGTVGTPALRAKIGAGFYYSAATVPQTIDLFTISAHGELHLLPAFGSHRSTWSPYLVAGVTRNHQSFRGLHPSIYDGSNYSITAEPLLCTVSSILFATGGGLARQFTLGDNFLNLFAEANTLYSMHQKAETQIGEINLSNLMSFSIGVSFGKRH